MTDDETDELPRRVERVIAKASSHEGDIEVLTLRWPAHGLIFEWTAGADWHDELVGQALRGDGRGVPGIR
jgi:hypothetical protein